MSGFGGRAERPQGFCFLVNEITGTDKGGEQRTVRFFTMPAVVEDSVLKFPYLLGGELTNRLRLQYEDEDVMSMISVRAVCQQVAATFNEPSHDHRQLLHFPDQLEEAHEAKEAQESDVAPHHLRWQPAHNHQPKIWEATASIRFKRKEEHVLC